MACPAGEATLAMNHSIIDLDLNGWPSTGAAKASGQCSNLITAFGSSQLLINLYSPRVDEHGVDYACIVGVVTGHQFVCLYPTACAGTEAAKIASKAPAATDDLLLCEFLPLRESTFVRFSSD